MLNSNNMPGVFPTYIADYDEFTMEETEYFVTNRMTGVDYRIVIETDQSILQYDPETGDQDPETGIWEDPGELTTEGADPYDQLPQTLLELLQMAKVVEYRGRDGNG